MVWIADVWLWRREFKISQKSRDIKLIVTQGTTATEI